MKIDEQKTETLYKQAYKIAKSEASSEMQKIILKNLESFYQNLKQMEKAKDIKNLLKAFDSGKKQTMEEEESSVNITNSSAEELIKESPKLSSISFIDDCMEEEDFEIMPKKMEHKPNSQKKKECLNLNQNENIPNKMTAKDFYLQYCRLHVNFLNFHLFFYFHSANFSK